MKSRFMSLCALWTRHKVWDWLMKILVFASMCLFAAAALAQAQTTHPQLTITPTDSPPPLTTESPTSPEKIGGVLIGGDAKPNSNPSSHRTCVDVQIGEEKSYSCLNEHLREQVDKFNPGVPNPPLDANRRISTSELRTCRL